jgi:hypothetical protein
VTRRRPPTCEVRTASDGTVVRVRGQLSQDELDAIVAAATAHMDSRCGEPSDVPLKLPRKGHPFYTCGRQAGHGPPHRWPAEPRPGLEPLAEWWP